MTPREKATALLAEALRRHRTNTTSAPDEFDIRQVEAVLSASPVLAAALDLGAAWQMAEAALPEGWAVNLLWGTITEERWGANAGPFPAKAGYSGITAGGSTPDEALAALATALVNGSAGADDTEGAAK